MMMCLCQCSHSKFHTYFYTSRGRIKCHCYSYCGTSGNHHGPCHSVTCSNSCIDNFLLAKRLTLYLCFIINYHQKFLIITDHKKELQTYELQGRTSENGEQCMHACMLIKVLKVAIFRGWVIFMHK